MVHASSEVITYLQDSSNDITISDLFLVHIPKTNECKICALTKSHHTVSRNSEKFKTSDVIFYQIKFDLIQFNIAINKNQWCSYITYFTTNFNLVYTHQHKSDTWNILCNAFALIKCYFKGCIIFFI